MNIVHIAHNDVSDMTVVSQGYELSSTITRTLNKYCLHQHRYAMYCVAGYMVVLFLLYVMVA